MVNPAVIGSSAPQADLRCGRDPTAGSTLDAQSGFPFPRILGVNYALARTSLIEIGAHAIRGDIRAAPGFAGIEHPAALGFFGKHIDGHRV
jgi:hypothetical protein